LHISDHRQSVFPAPSRGLPHTPALLVVADSAFVVEAKKINRIIIFAVKTILNAFFEKFII
jgi:hypothetical protein